MQNKDNKAAAAHSWSRYWADGKGVTCYTGAQGFSLEKIWKSFFASLPKGAHILDLATGNGAVAHLACQYSDTENKNFHVTGVDYAAIRTQPRAGLVFHPQTSIETLPFDAQSFDAVISQYGFEYAAIEAATAEAGRVLKAGGAMRLLIHAQNGAVVTDAQTRLARLRAALLDNGLLSDIKTMAALEVKKGPQKARRLNHYKKLAQHCDQVLPDVGAHLQGADGGDSALKLTRFLLTLWAHRDDYVPDDVLAKAIEVETEAASYVMRLEAMNHAAQSQKDMDKLVQGFKAVGVVCEKPVLIGSEGKGSQPVLAWCVDGKRTVGRE